jgi:hypothetical protein
VKRKKRKTRQERKQKVQTPPTGRGEVQPSRPLLGGLNLSYEVSDRVQAIDCGGIGVVHTLVEKLGLIDAINRQVHLFKRHVPYWESDHVLHLSYNILTGGTCLQDLERLREDAGYRDALGVDRLPHPTTAGDFLRRFRTQASVLRLQESINQARTKVWERQPDSFRKQAIIDVDGTHASTLGECKQDMGLSHEGIWGYAPLIVSLAATREVLYIVNRPGNVVSHDGAVEWIDRAIALTQATFQQVWVRGDTDFSLTGHFDRWDAQGIRFVFGLDAMPNLVEKAQALPEEAWDPLERSPSYEVKTHPRKRPPNVKAQIVRQKGFKNITLLREDVAEFAYQPVKCRKAYRVVVLRKQLRITRADVLVEQTVRYLFYITNDMHKTSAGIVALGNDRCDQENHIEQLKNGVGALRCPTGDLYSNWAYMIIATLAWNLKAWVGLLMPNRKVGWQVVRMEFKRFLLEWIRLPAQVLRTARRLVIRLLKITWNTPALLDTFGVIKHIRSP